MEVILLERIRNVGNLGDIVRVKAGYGRNFLIPQKKAIQATKENKAVFEGRRAELVAKEQQALNDAKVRAEKLASLKITLEAQATEDGKLYGSVGPAELAKAISAAGVEVVKREINMPHGVIHELGDLTLDVQVHTDVVAYVSVSIIEAKKN